MNKFTLALLLILTALLAGGGVYFWQQNAVASLEKKIGELEAENEDLLDSMDEEEEESALKTFSFGTVSYELDYPADWTTSADEDRTVFVDANGTKMMTLWWNWEGGIESNILSSKERSFDKNGQTVRLGFSAFGEAKVENVLMMLSVVDNDLWADYSAALFLDPSLVESGVADAIFESIR